MYFTFRVLHSNDSPRKMYFENRIHFFLIHIFTRHEKGEGSRVKGEKGEKDPPVENPFVDGGVR